MFRFDDIWLGLIARKANVEPFHCPEFHFYPKDKSRVSVLNCMIYQIYPSEHSGAALQVCGGLPWFL